MFLLWWTYETNTATCFSSFFARGLEGAVSCDAFPVRSSVALSHRSPYSFLIPLHPCVLQGRGLRGGCGITDWVAGSTYDLIARVYLWICFSWGYVEGSSQGTVVPRYQLGWGQSVLPSGLRSLRSSDLDARRGVLPAVEIISLL